MMVKLEKPLVFVGISKAKVEEVIRLHSSILAYRDSQINYRRDEDPLCRKYKFLFEKNSKKLSSEKVISLDQYNIMAKTIL